jgi:uncharacterized protein (DUF433 family)
MDTILSINLIASNPDVRGGRPCIAGTSIRVTDLVMQVLFHHVSSDQLASDFDLTLAQVHAALAYYYEHKAELDEDIRQQIAKARQLKENHVGGKSPLRY